LSAAEQRWLAMLREQVGAVDFAVERSVTRPQPSRSPPTIMTRW
jgi:hypothetical protein